MKILITGANGFIGRKLTIYQLKNGNEVYAFVTSKKDMDNIVCDKLHVFELDFNNYHNISSLVSDKIDVVFHLAWDGLSGEKAKDVKLQSRNVLSTYELLLQAKKMSVRRFVFISTMNSIEIRNMLDNPVYYKTRGVYIHVAAKINAEIIARTMCEENNIIYNEALLAMAYGENNKSKMITNVFIYSLLNNIKPRLVEGNNKYDIIYIDDIISALDLISRRGINKKSYYVGHSWDKTFKDIFTDIKNIINPNFEIEFGAYPDDNQIDFTKINRAELTEDTGWMPKADFKQSIISTAKWIDESKIVFK